MVAVERRSEPGSDSRACRAASARLPSQRKSSMTRALVSVQSGSRLEALISKAAVEALHEAVLPRAALIDVDRLDLVGGLRAWPSLAMMRSRPLSLRRSVGALLLVDRSFSQANTSVARMARAAARMPLAQGPAPSDQPVLLGRGWPSAIQKVARAPAAESGHAMRPAHCPRATTAWAAAHRCAGLTLFSQRPLPAPGSCGRASASIFFKFTVFARRFLGLARFAQLSWPNGRFQRWKTHLPRCYVLDTPPGCFDPGRRPVKGGFYLRLHIACLSCGLGPFVVSQTNPSPGPEKRKSCHLFTNDGSR